MIVFMSGLTQESFINARESAKNCAEEIHSHSGCSAYTHEDNKNERYHNEKKCIHKSDIEKNESFKNYKNPLESIFSAISGAGIKMDRDTLLIILLIVILLKNGTDKKLLFALGYIIIS